MALRQTKKISELPALSPATLDTTFIVGISGSTTYKISINQLTSSLDTTFATDLVTTALSNSLDTKLSTSSYSTDSASFNSRIISGSAVAGTISGSSQISALGFVTGSYTTINSFNSLTQSFNSISQSFTTVSGSFGSIDFSGINNVTTSYLAFTQSYYSASASFDSRINTVSASVSIGTSGTSGINGTSGTNGTSGAQGNQGPTGPQGNQGPQGESGTSGTTGTSGTNGVQGPQGTQGVEGPQGINGTAGSSGAQGSQGPIGSQGNQGANGSNGTNGSQGNQGPQGNQGATGSGTQGAQGPTGPQGTQGNQGHQGNQGTQGVQGANGTSGTSGVSIDSGSFATTSSFNSYTASANGRLDTLEGTIITGSPNYVQVLGNQRVTSTPGTSIISGSITTSGNPVQIIVTGDANPTAATGQWCTLQIHRDNSAIGGIVQVEAANSNENQAYCVNVIDTPSAGTYTYSLRMNANGGGNFQFGESSGPLLTAVELRTNTNLPSTNNTFTGTNTFSGSTIFRGAVNFNNPTGSGASSEGGQINLGLATQNQTLTGSVIIDVYENKLRLFEEGGNNRGAYLNVVSQSNSVGSSIVTSPNLLTMQTITSASYAALTPVSGTLYIIIG